ncbi:Do family serine endopeptidase [Fulvimarina sp. 2208YS6-2-32]|uniref:Do family serine endopeptidase n=1 Tax=Fulvimarina uroteuthidis TaxID=3098149 RepID=A0ABU5I5I5_9HYPH|nr:Do family serine endopeptidase [Fulvimarina sp. 2208YS6-2-32]MDY8110655.1 Do family serine endopeptidase [Fulvimarina sp. 2208YS6-2-32]
MVHPHRAALFALVILLAAGASAPLATAEGWSLRGLFGGEESEDQSATPDPSPAPVPETLSGARTEAVPASPSEITLTFAPLVRKTAPAVVNVYAARAVPPRLSPFAGDPFFGQFFGGPTRPAEPRIESSLGSGVIVDPGGLIVTNNHVIADADEVRIAFADGREFETEIVLKDAKVDLAVLKVSDPTEAFPSIELADSDGIEIGDLVLAIGNPFGIGQTVTNGIVSALSRTHLKPGDPGVFIQTDAAINPGNSGGALIDMGGRLVGVNTAIFSKSGGSNGIGFAIPSNLVASFIRAAKAGGSFSRPYIGASFGQVSPDIAEAVGLARPTGAIVFSVAEGSPADIAGLEEGDVILEVGSVAITDPDALGYRLATAGIGSTTTLTVLRGEARETLSLPLTGAPETPPRDARLLEGRTPFSGATVWTLSPKVAEELDLPLEKTGVVIADVERGSFAARFGLRPRDIVIALNGERVATSAGLERLLSEAWGGYEFEIERGGRRLMRRVR